MQRRKLKDLNVLDDFLFGTILGHPVWGEYFGRILLETIFHRKLAKLKVVPQRNYYGKDTDLHGARMDVYFEEIPEADTGGNASVYDLEPDRNKEDLQKLSRRTRFYHALIDADCLRAGEDYTSLKNVVVLFVMPDDPFGAGRMVYTVRSMCAEIPGFPYDDGAQTVFLYTKGTKGNPSKELRELLCYMEDSVEENAVNENLKQLHRVVEAAKQNREVRLDYMKSWEREQKLRTEAREAGMAEGRTEERLNTERERRRADLAEERLAQEKERAGQERQRAELAEAELKRLQEELQKYKKDFFIDNHF